MVTVMLNSFLKKVAGRKAGATRGGTPGSHVNKKANKRIASKSIRIYEDCMHGTCDLARCTCAYLEDEEDFISY